MSVPKSVIKKDLRDWLHNRMLTRQSQLSRELERAIDDVVLPIIKTMFHEYDELQRTANKLLELVAEYQEKLGGYSKLTYDQRQISSHLNNAFCGIVRDHQVNLRKWVHKYIWDPTESVSTGNVELDESVKNLAEMCKPTIEKIRSIDTMWTEIEGVIDSAHNGKAAYKALVALGIDLRDYSNSTNLPAVVKLSGDVCLINQTC